MDAQWDFCSAKTPTFELRVLLDSRNLQPVLGSRINENGHGQSHDCQVSNVKVSDVDVLLFHFDANATMSF